MIHLFNRNQNIHTTVSVHTVWVAVETSLVHEAIILDKNRPNSTTAYMSELIPQQATYQSELPNLNFCL